MFRVMVVAVSAIVSYTIAVFSVLARAARLPIEDTFTALPTLASSSNSRSTALAKTRFDSVARSTCFDQMSGENTPSAIVLSTNSVAPVATGYSFRRCPEGQRSPPRLLAAHVDASGQLDAHARSRSALVVEVAVVLLERHGSDLGVRDLAVRLRRPSV